MNGFHQHFWLFMPHVVCDFDKTEEDECKETSQAFSELLYFAQKARAAVVRRYRSPFWDRTHATSCSKLWTREKPCRRSCRIH